MTTKSMRPVTLFFGEEKLGFSQKEVGIPSLWSGFSMELFIYKLYPETLMIMGRWSRSSFLRCIHIQVSNLSKGMSTLMTKKQSFYKIMEAKIVYHTPGQ